MSKALIIEDDLTSAKVVSTLLESLNFSTEIFSTGKEGIDYIKESIKSKVHLSLLCVDVNLPDSDGIALLEQLRNFEEKNGKVGNDVTPVLFITGDDDMETFTDALSLANTGFLLKPISKDKLTKELSKFGLLVG